MLFVFRAMNWMLITTHEKWRQFLAEEQPPKLSSPHMMSQTQETHVLYLSDLLNHLPAFSELFWVLILLVYN